MFGILISSLQVVFLRALWNELVNLPILSKNIFEPKPNTKRQPSRTWTERPIGSVVRNPLHQFTSEQQNSQHCQSSLGEGAEITRTPSPLLLPSALSHPTVKRTFTMDCRRKHTSPRQHTYTTQEHRTAPHTMPTETFIPHAYTHHTPHKQTPPHHTRTSESKLSHLLCL